MEPSGLMDDAHLRPTAGPAASLKLEYNVYDMADEEVHFTRNPLPGSSVQYHYAPAASVSATPNQPPSIQCGQPASPTFTEISLNFSPRQSNASSEQLKSSKLLNAIGSKLRRGSNYLTAPKLVGEYLLGITIRDWSEFLNTSRMIKAPSTTNQLTRRLLNNLAHFQGNYLCVSLVLVIYCILTSPLLLLALMAYLAALYLVTARSALGKQLQIAGYRPNLRQQYSFLTLVSLPLLWVAGAPSAVFWVIGASFVVVGLHASMFNNDRALDELPEQPETQAVPSVGFRPSQVPYYSHQPAALAQKRSYTALAQNQAARPAGWMPFGGGPAAPARQQAASQRQANVTVISQDFAGLGRVYEV